MARIQKLSRLSYSKERYCMEMGHPAASGVPFLYAREALFRGMLVAKGNANACPVCG
jgi:hypothetical protein